MFLPIYIHMRELLSNRKKNHKRSSKVKTSKPQESQTCPDKQFIQNVLNIDKGWGT